MTDPSSSLPVTILTGFLGAGKTTLLNYLLQQASSERIVIVENEFGEVGIDAALLEASAATEVIELNNGCICCTVRGELTAALHMLLERREAGLLAFDRVILETTGLADPAPLIQTFFVDERLRQRFALDAVITLIDAEYAQTQLNEHRVAVAQVGFADRLILTKLERIDLSAKRRLIDRLRIINVRAPILEAYYGQLPVNAWIDIHAFNFNDMLTIDPSYIAQSSQTHSYSPVKQTPTILKRSWNDNITSYVFKGGIMDIKLIGEFMENTIAEYGNDMLRYKGILAIAADTRRLIVQGVHRVVAFDYGGVWLAGELCHTLLVVIARQLPIKELQEKFYTCQVNA